MLHFVGQLPHPRDSVHYHKHVRYCSGSGVVSGVVSGGGSGGGSGVGRGGGRKGSDCVVVCIITGICVCVCTTTNSVVSYFKKQTNKNRIM